MTAKQTENLVRALARLGVTYVKTSEIEVHLSANSDAHSDPIVEQVETSLPRSPLQTPQATVASPPQPKEGEKSDKEIPHTIEELASLLKLSDKDLLDRLFPDATQEEVEE